MTMVLCLVLLGLMVWLIIWLGRNLGVRTAHGLSPPTPDRAEAVCTHVTVAAFPESGSDSNGANQGT